MILKKSHPIFLLCLAFTLTSGASTLHSKPKRLDLRKAESLFQFVLPLEEDTLHKKVQMLRYDEHRYELAYTVYLQNNNIKNAYTVAFSAVKQRPGNKLWRERLTKMALWNKEASVALEQYTYLLYNFKDKEAGEKGLQLAKSLHDDEAWIQLFSYYITHRNTSEKNWKNYIDIMLHLGKMQQLIKVLKTNQDQLSLSLYLDSLSKIYKVLDDPNAQLAVLKQLSAKLGMIPMVAEKMSEIYLSRGQITQAQQVLSLARKKARAEDFDFWQAYARMSYLANNSQEELYATQQILKKKSSIDMYARLIELTTRNSSSAALHYAQEAKRLYPHNYAFAADTFSLMVAQKQCLNFPKLVATTPAPLLKLLQYEGTYWDARAYYWRQIGNDQEVLKTYLSGMQYLPQNDYFKADFINYLIQSNNLALIKKVLPLWQSQLVEKPHLWGSYAEAYARVNNNPMMSKLILSLFYEQLEQYAKNPYWLILFKDTLENSFFEKQSDEVSRYAWPVYVNTLKNQSDSLEYLQLVDYVKLSLLNAAGDPTAAALSLLQNQESEDVEQLILAWALEHNNINLAKTVYWRYKQKGIEAPLWARLSIALARYDRRTLRNLLLDKKEIVSYRDKVQAAIRIDAIPLAQTTAYKSLERNRKDHDLYDHFFTPVMLQTSDNFYISQEYYQYGNVEGPRTNTSYTYFLTPGISLTPYNSLWFINNVSPATSDLIDLADNDLNANNQIFATVPPKDERVGIKIDTLQRRGKLNFDLGYRDNLGSFMTAKVTRTYRTYSDLDLNASLGYNQPAEDTSSLLIAGMEDNAVLGFRYRVFAGDYLSGEYQQNIFHTQDNQYLANGTQVTLRFDHQFWKEYPDWTLSPYGTVSQYYNKTNQMLRGNILELIPEGVDPDVNFLIPDDFNEFGLTLSFGQMFVEDYTHRWRPFSSLTLSQNSNVGLGKLFNVGIAGTVWGRDHLLFYYEWGTNQGQGLQAERLIKVSYRIYV